MSNTGKAKGARVKVEIKVFERLIKLVIPSEAEGPAFTV
jgi:hypothetical protein